MKIYSVVRLAYLCCMYHYVFVGGVVSNLFGDFDFFLIFSVRRTLGKPDELEQLEKFNRSWNDNQNGQ